MEKIYQRFDLDLGSLAELLGLESMNKLNELSKKGRRKLRELNFPKATKTLRRILLGKGYEFLESNDVYCGLHGSIILGGELRKMNHKADFYGLAAKFDLPYRSGHCYFEAKLEQLAQSEKPLIPSRMPIATNSRPVNPFTDSHFYDDYEPGNR